MVDLVLGCVMSGFSIVRLRFGFLVMSWCAGLCFVLLSEEEFWICRWGGGLRVLGGWDGCF